MIKRLTKKLKIKREEIKKLREGEIVRARKLENAVTEYVVTVEKAINK